jgi:hypothetical protein
MAAFSGARRVFFFSRAEAVWRAFFSEPPYCPVLGVRVSLQLRNTVEELKENKKAAGNAKVPFAARCLLFSALPACCCFRSVC